MAKHKSRAKRCAEAADRLTNQAAELREFAEKVRGLRDETFPEGTTATTVKLGTLLDGLSLEVDGDGSGEIESLKDELQEWYDNLPENFQNGDKGDQLQQAIDQLQEAVDGFDGVDFPDLDPEKDMTDTDLDELADSLERAGDELDTAADTATNTEFPGMYS
jgi:hypothetical protein